MRWFRIRKANIEPELRETYERHGVGVMQQVLATTNYFRHRDESIMSQDPRVQATLLPWLTEQYDRAERKETWSLTMEFAITVFVAAEGLPLIISFVSGNSK